MVAMVPPPWDLVAPNGDLLVVENTNELRGLAAPAIAAIAAAATATPTNCHSRRRARLPAPCPAASKPSLPPSARAPSIRARASS